MISPLFATRATLPVVPTVRGRRKVISPTRSRRSSRGLPTGRETHNFTAPRAYINWIVDQALG